MGPAKVVEGSLRQHPERAPAREHHLRDGVDRAIPTRGDDDPLLLLRLLYGALRQPRELPWVMRAPEVVPSARLGEHVSDDRFRDYGVTAARTSIHHDEEGTCKRHTAFLVAAWWQHAGSGPRQRLLPGLTPDVIQRPGVASWPRDPRRIPGWEARCQP